MDDVHRILTFWFGQQPCSNDSDYWKQKNTLWFGVNADADQHITKTFKPLLLQAKNNDFCNWQDTASGRLALIILTDQFPRNIYRSTNKAFSFDRFALKQCLEGLEAGQHLELHPVHQVFFFMPLEHSENIKHQNTCAELLASLVLSSSAALLSTMENFHAFAIKHLDIIAQFGRFPHRNALLGRKSTAAELEYLQASSFKFGQG